MARDAAVSQVSPFAPSPVDAALLGQEGDRGGLVGGVAGGPAAVLGGCRRDGIDLSVDGEVFVQVLDFHLPPRGHLIGHGCLVTGNLEERRK